MIALCAAAASAQERVTYNKTALDCVPEGCFVVRYVPAPRLKPKTKGYQNGSEENQQARPTGNKPETAPHSTLSPTADVPTSDNLGEPKISHGEQNEADGNSTPRQFLWLYPNEWVALFTFVLMASTVALWRTASKQGVTMQETLDQMRTSDAERSNEFANQLKVTKESSDAATRTAQSYIDTERAWLFLTGGFEPQTVSDPNRTDKQNPSFLFIARWKNTGKTPAVNVELCGGRCILNIDDPVPDSFEFIRKPSGPQSGTIGPEMPFNNLSNITKQEMIEVADEKKRLILWSTCIYKDVFSNKQRITAVCAEVTTVGGSVNLESKNLTREFFQIEIKGKHNYAK
ncbi:MAG: hypothetical protein AAF720_00195 [Pseudomonadota bacterium]